MKLRFECEFRTKISINSGNACCNSVQNHLLYRLLPKNIKIKIYNTIILHAVLYGCEIWSLREKKLRLFDNRVLCRMLEPKGGIVMEGLQNIS
jgi:hypothetical protein